MTTKEFTEGWKHFCDCMDFGKSAMDADAIRFMNEAPSKIIQCLDSQPDLLAACEAQEEADKWFGPSNTGKKLKDKAKELRIAAIAKAEPK